MVNYGRHPSTFCDTRAGNVQLRELGTFLQRSELRTEDVEVLWGVRNGRSRDWARRSSGNDIVPLGCIAWHRNVEIVSLIHGDPPQRKHSSRARTYHRCGSVHVLGSRTGGAGAGLEEGGLLQTDSAHRRRESEARIEGERAAAMSTRALRISVDLFPNSLALVLEARATLVYIAWKHE